jgi:hypothetical protein
VIRGNVVLNNFYGAHPLGAGVAVAVAEQPADLLGAYVRLHAPHRDQVRVCPPAVVGLQLGRPDAVEGHGRRGVAAGSVMGASPRLRRLLPRGLGPPQAAAPRPGPPRQSPSPSPSPSAAAGSPPHAALLHRGESRGLSGSADPDKFYKYFSKILLKFIKICMI